jgi:predicted SnoaL-like aldol condensation-catalyzing enzyme
MVATQSRKDAAIEFLTLVASGDVHEAYQQYVGQGFRHHNPFFRGDAASLMEEMEQNAAKNPNRVFEVQRALQDGDYVAVLSHVRQKPEDRGGAVLHVFRFEGDRIAEFWDTGQAYRRDRRQTASVRAGDLSPRF